MLANDTEVKGKLIDKNKYEITSDMYKYIVTFDKDVTNVVGYYNDAEEFKAKIENKKDNFRVTVTSEDASFDINMETINMGNKFAINITNDNLKLAGNFETKNDEKAKTTTVTGKLDGTYDTYKVSLELNSDLKYGSNLVTEKSFANAISSENITEDDATTYTIRAMGKLMKFDLYTTIYGLISSLQV